MHYVHCKWQVVFLAVQPASRSSGLGRRIFRSVCRRALADARLEIAGEPDPDRDLLLDQAPQPTPF